MTEVSEHVYTTNAPKGAERFDTDFPGWADRIDLDKFNMRTCGGCAAAQIAGDGWYYTALRELFPAIRNDGDALHEMARKYGFYIDVSSKDFDSDEHGPEYADMWNALQADWEHLIAARRTAAD